MYMEEVVKDFLVWIGEEPNREGLKDTPKRVVKMYEELTAGYRMKKMKSHHIVSIML